MSLFIFGKTVVKTSLFALIFSLGTKRGFLSFRFFCFSITSFVFSKDRSLVAWSLIWLDCKIKLSLLRMSSVKKIEN